MNPTTGQITVRYWASARAAAGTEQEKVDVDGEVTLAWLKDRLVGAHDSSKFAQVLGCCAVMVGDRPAGKQAAAEVVVRPGDSVEFLPPFAGG